MSTIITFHYDGPISPNHDISLRTLGKTLQHLQSAIDRAHLDIKHGRVWKHARPTKKDQEATNFIVGRPRDGGYILDILSGTASEIVKRVSNAIGTVEQSEQSDEAGETARLLQQAQDRKVSVRKAMDFSDYIQSEDTSLTTTYGNRSIAKEIDQILSLIRAKNSTSTLNFHFKGDDFSTDYGFNNESARAFHKTVSRRDLGNPLWVVGNVRELDGGDQFTKPKGKFINAITKRMHTLHIEDESGYNMLVPYMPKRSGESKKVRILACPVHEFGAFEPYGGDLYFLGVVENV